MIRNTFITLIALACVAFSAASRADILTNGSFEDPVVPAASFTFISLGSFIGTNNGTPWTYVSNNAGPFVNLRTYVIADNFPGYGGKTTPFGNQYYGMGEPPYVTTTTQGVINPALGHYELSFWQASLPGTTGAVALDFRLGSLTAFSSALAGGQQTFTVAAGSDWVRQSVEFDITTAGNYYVAFSSVVGNYGLIDNVQLNLVPNPVPEPETYALMLAGLGAIGWVRRRRKSGNTSLT